MNDTNEGVFIPQALAQQLLNYLATKPWVEVNDMIQKLVVASQQQPEGKEAKDGSPDQGAEE